jgi:hypothetical protein
VNLQQIKDAIIKIKNSRPRWKDEAIKEFLIADSGCDKNDVDSVFADFEKNKTSQTPTNGHSAPAEVKQAEQISEAKPEQALVVPSNDAINVRPTFRELATASVQRGEPRVLPIVVGGKNPSIKWKGTPFDLSSVEEWSNQVREWIDSLAAQFPEFNCAVVAKPNERLFIDEDDSETFRQGFEAWSGEAFPRTYTTSARPNRCQSHWLQTDAARQMGNVSQQATFSVRQHNLYVLTEGSQHKNGVDIYKVVDDSPVVPMSEKLVEYILFIRKRDKAPSQAAMESVVLTGTDEQKLQQFLASIPDESIAYHTHDDTLTSIAGTLRQRFKMGPEDMYPALVDVCERCCAGYGSDYQDMCRKITHSVGRYPIKPSGEMILDQKPTATVTAASVVPEIDDSEVALRPVFPYWCLKGTSIYDGLVEPAIQSSSKHAEFIMLPAIQMMLNFLSGHVTVGFNKTNHNIFLGLISPYGEFFKSSSCKLAQDYFKMAGCSATYGRDTNMAEGKVIVAQAGSPEGFGLSISKINGCHAILFNDELGKFVSKASIESSSFSSDLLSWYESADFGNSITSSKNNFSFPGGSYTFSWLWATTDRGFNRHWPKLAGISSGLEDRMFFVISPEKAKEAKPYRDPIFVEGAARTRRLIDKALSQKKYEFEDLESYSRSVAGLDPRSMNLVEKLSLYFCIDMEGTIIDQEHIDRAVALVKYRNQASAFLAPIEADNHQGRLQKEIIRELQQHRGKMKYRDLCRNLDFNRYGLDVWQRAYKTMVQEGLLADFTEQTTAGKRASRMTGLLKLDD